MLPNLLHVETAFAMGGDPSTWADEPSTPTPAPAPTPTKKVYSDKEIAEGIAKLNNDLAQLQGETTTSLQPINNAADSQLLNGTGANASLTSGETNDIINAVVSATSWATAALADGTKEAWKAGKGLAYKEGKIGVAKLLNFGPLFGPLISLFLDFACSSDKHSPEFDAINNLANTLAYFQEQTNAHFNIVNRKIDLATICPFVQEQITMQQNFRTANGGTDALTAELNAKKFFTGETPSPETFDMNTKSIYHLIGEGTLINGKFQFSTDNNNTNFVGNLQKFGNALVKRNVNDHPYNTFDLYAAYKSLANEINTQTFADREKWNETIKDDWVYLTQVATLGVLAESLRSEATSIALDRLTNDEKFWKDKTSPTEISIKADLINYSNFKKQDECKALNLLGKTVTKIDPEKDYQRTYGDITAAEHNTTTPLTELSQKIEQGYIENQKVLAQEKALANEGNYYDFAADTSFTIQDNCPLYRAVLGSAGGAEAQQKKWNKTSNTLWGTSDLNARGGQFVKSVNDLDGKRPENCDNNPQGYNMENALSSKELSNLIAGLDAKNQTLSQYFPELKDRPVYANNFDPTTDDKGVESGFMYWPDYDLYGDYYQGNQLNSKIKNDKGEERGKTRAFYEYYSFMSSEGVGNRWLPTKWQHNKMQVTILKKGKDFPINYLIH
jgi:hypothetical protein